MPKDYTKIGVADTSLVSKDYTAIGKNGNPAVGKDYTQLKPPPLGQDSTKLFTDMQRVLEKRGYGQDTLAQLMAPVGSLTSPMVLDSLYGEVKSSFERNPKGVEEALKFIQDANTEFGAEPTFAEKEALTTLLERFASEATLGNLSEVHKWWMSTKRQLGDKAASTYEGTMVNVTLGLALLDVIDKFDKAGLGTIKGVPVISGKLDVLGLPVSPVSPVLGHPGFFPGWKAIPLDTMAEIENRVIPPLTLETPDGPKDFDTSTAAALWIAGQKIYGFGEKTAALYLDAATKLPRKIEPFNAVLNKLTGNETMDEFVANMRESGEERSTMALGQIPPLVSALGEPSTKLGSEVTWMEIAERKLGLEQEFDKMYEWMGETDYAGKPAMFMWALANGAADAIVVPSTVVSGVVGKIQPALKAAVKAIPETKFAASGIERSTEAALKQAYSTKRLDDMFEALSVAREYHDEAKAALDVAVSEQRRTTGQSRAPGGVLRRYWMARRQLNDAKQLIETTTMPGEGDVLLQTPRRNPLLLPAPAEDADVATKEIFKHRKEWLETGPTQAPKWSDADRPAFQQRAVFGADDTEQAAYGLEAMIKTGGEAVDDITISPIAPEYQITPSHGPIDFIDWQDVPKIKARAQAEQRFVDSISGKGLPETPGQMKFEDHSLRLLLQEEDILRRNLGTARSLKDKAGIDIHTKNLAEIRTRIDELKGTPLSDKAKIFDDVLLFPEQPTIMNNAERFNRWLGLAGDRVIRGLYPGSMLSNFWHSGTGQLFAVTRNDPGRYYQSLAPDTWNTIRNGMLMEAQSNAAMNSKLREILLEAQVLRPHKGKFNPKKMFHEYKVDDQNSKLLYDFLNTKTSEPEYAALRQVMPEEMVKAHDHIREIMDVAADLQGIRGDKYLEGYIHHMFDKSLVAKGGRIPQGIGMPRNVEVFASHLFNRRGNTGYKRDAVAALELYGRMMHRKTYREPIYEAIRRTGDDLYGKTGNSFHRTYADAFVRQLEGKPGFLSEMIDSFVGASVHSLGKNYAPGSLERKLMGWTGLVHSSLLGGNPRYAFMQISTSLVTTASRYGMLRTMKGLFKMATKEGQALAKSSGAYSSFIDLLEVPEMRNLSKFVFEKWPAVTPFGVMSNAKAELLSRGMSMWAAIDLHLNKLGISTWQEAVQQGLGRNILYSAIKSSEEVNHLFGALGRNPIFLWGTPIPLGSRVMGHGFSSAVSQFLSFIPKQTDELLFQAMRDPGAIIKYMMISGWASKIAAEDLGVDMTDYVGLGYLPKESRDIASPGMDMMINMVNYAAAHNNNDMTEIARTGRNLIESASNILPTKVQLTSLSKMANRLKEKEIRKSTGEKLMDLDFKNVQGFQKLRPSDVPREEGGAPGLGGQFLPTVMQLPDIRERLTRRALDAGRHEEERFRFNLQSVMTNLANALEAGDSEKVEKLEEELREMSGNKIRLTSGDPIRRAMEARYISEVIRYWAPQFNGDKVLLDRRIETLRRFGINPAPTIPQEQ